MKIIVLEQVERDVRDIGHYIALDNPMRAASFTKELMAAAYKIVEFPKVYFLLNKRLALRRKIHGNYAIYYQLSATQITVLRIIHSARKTKTRDLL